jgi:NitT/TauT family transport system ATP-binding protein
VFLADQIVILSSRPATVQRIFNAEHGADRTLHDLYTPRSAEMLAQLRDEIEIAQGRTPAAAEGA